MYSKLAAKSKFNTKCYNKRQQPVSKITIHHMAGSMSAASCIDFWKRSGRQVSANYVIGKDGEIVCMLEEEFRAWTSSSSWNDHRAITIEVANSGGSPSWEVSAVVLQSLINLCADICSRYDITPAYTGDSKGSFTFHCMYTQTECPGPYIKSNIKDILRKIKDNLSIPKDYKVKVTAKSLNIRDGAGTKYKIVGKITDQGIYTITDIQNGWGKLKSGAGWISLKYTKEV